MEKQNHEASRYLWSLEKDGLINVLGTSPEITDAVNNLIEVVDPKIEDYSLTYEEFVSDIANEFEKIIADESAIEENRAININKLLTNLTEKYKIG